MKEKIITLNKNLLIVFSTIFFIFIAFNTNVFADDSDIVYIPNADLKADINTELGIEDTTADITKGQLKTITKLHIYGNERITDISVLQYMTNLKILYIFNCYFLTDISVLSHLTNLEIFSIHACYKISDISPIKNLEKLNYIRISSCESITDISLLSKFTNLRDLDITDCPQITDFSVLSKLTNLINLEISGNNNLRDISILKNLTKLESLHLEKNDCITDISVLKELTNLRQLSLIEFTNITDISVIKNLTELYYLDISDINITEKNEVSYKETISSLINLRCLVIEGANISNEHTSMFKTLTNLEKLYISGNHITDYSFISSLKKLVQINLLTDTVNTSEVNLNIFDTVNKYKIKNDVKDANGNYVKPAPSEYYDYNETTNDIIIYIDKIKDNKVLVNYEFDIQNMSYSEIFVIKDITLNKFTPSLVVNGSTSMLNKIKGEDINLEVVTTSNDSNNYTYKFAVLNEENNKWSVLRNFDKNSALNYSLDYTGTKIFAVTVMDNQNNTISTNRLKVNVYEPLESKLTVNNATNNISKVIGSKITLNAKGNGGSGNYTYKFAVYNMETNKWSVLTDFTTSSTYTYSLDYEGKKRFAVTVKDSVGNSEISNYLYVDVYKPLKGNLKVNDSKEAITTLKGTKINLVATGYYGSENYTYKFAVYNEDTNKWSVLRDFSSANSLEYALNYPGKKVFAVTIKDSLGNTIATNRIQVTVYEPLESKLTVNNSTDTIAKVIGSKIILNAKGYGGSENYTYKFAVYNMETSKWSVLTEFTKSSTYTYALDYEGRKRFAVTVKDSLGNSEMSNYLYVDVYKPLKGNLKVNDSKDPITVKKGTKINLVSTGYYGSGEYTYKFAVLNEDTGKWSVLRDFSPNKTLEYSLDYAGKKQFAVTVMDRYGNTVSTNRICVNVI